MVYLLSEKRLMVESGESDVCYRSASAPLWWTVQLTIATRGRVLLACARCRMPLCRIFLLLLLFGSSSLGADLRTLAGKTMTGEVVGINDKSIILKTEAGEVATPLADVLELKLQDPGSLPSGTKYSDVELIDGTMLHCTRFAIKKREAELTVVPGIEVRLPLASISYILSGSDDAKRRAE